MRKRITNAKIACLDINLQKARMQLGVQILVEDPNQLEEIRKRYVALYHFMCYQVMRKKRPSQRG